MADEYLKLRELVQLIDELSESSLDPMARKEAAKILKSEHNKLQRSARRSDFRGEDSGTSPYGDAKENPMGRRPPDKGVI